MSLKPSTSENQSKAPVCAAFVEAMRQTFGADQVTVLYVKEGQVELGRPDKTEYGHFVLQTPIPKDSDPRSKNASTEEAQCSQSE